MVSSQEAKTVGEHVRLLEHRRMARSCDLDVVGVGEHRDSGPPFRGRAHLVACAADEEDGSIDAAQQGSRVIAARRTQRPPGAEHDAWRQRLGAALDQFGSDQFLVVDQSVGDEVAELE